MTDIIEMSEHLYEFFKERDEKHQAVFEKAQNCLKERLSASHVDSQIQSVIRDIFSSKCHDSDYLIRHFKQLRQQDLFLIQSLQAQVVKQRQTINELKTKQEIEDMYMKNVVETSGQTVEFRNLSKEINEYQKLNEAQENRDVIMEESRKYSNVNRDLSLINAHLCLSVGTFQLKDVKISQETDPVEALPRDQLQILLDETATSVQKRTAMKILERVIMNQRKISSVETQTCEQIEQSTSLGPLLRKLNDTNKEMALWKAKYDTCKTEYDRILPQKHKLDVDFFKLQKQLTDMKN